ncbi:MAG: cell wall-binding repeat-containing protein [Euryarchaeota archaeon]|nr:cell wall-binding repeat-containing protein [Euryarchaeota archaeon]
MHKKSLAFLVTLLIVSSTVTISPTSAAEKVAVIATSDNFPDALAAGPFVAKNNYSLFLTPSDKLADEIKTALKNQSITKVIIIGGEVAISLSVENEIRALGIKTERIAGSDRDETAAMIAQRYGKTEYAIIVTDENFPDTLVSTSLAIALNCPIIFTKSKVLSKVSEDALKNVRKTIIVGGTDAVSKDVETKISQITIMAERIGGKDRYETSILVGHKYMDITKGKGPANKSIIITDGENFEDGLAAPILASVASPIMITPPGLLRKELSDFSKKYEIKTVYVVYGPKIPRGLIVAVLQQIRTFLGVIPTLFTSITISKLSVEINAKVNEMKKVIEIAVAVPGIGAGAAPTAGPSYPQTGTLTGTINATINFLTPMVGALSNIIGSITGTYSIPSGTSGTFNGTVNFTSITGNVAGNIITSGNIYGNVVGNVVGSVSGTSVVVNTITATFTGIIEAVIDGTRYVGRVAGSITGTVVSNVIKVTSFNWTISNWTYEKNITGNIVGNIL